MIPSRTKRTFNSQTTAFYSKPLFKVADTVEHLKSMQMMLKIKENKINQKIGCKDVILTGEPCTGRLDPGKAKEEAHSSEMRENNSGKYLRMCCIDFGNHISSGKSEITCVG